jgi:tetratricopeptide (TPR) repeat protein
MALSAQTRAGYADPAVCSACHAELAARYGRTGMARSFGVVKPGADPRTGAFSHAVSGETFTIESRNGAVEMERRESSPAGQPANVFRTSIDYWFGSGLHAKSYVSRTANNELIELPVSWYSEKGGYWGMSPGYDSASHAGFTRRLTYRCLFCHNAYPAMPAGADRMDNGTKFPASLPAGIDCQRCHGPGLAHASAAASGRPDAEVKALIVNPVKLNPERRDEVCLQCHLEPTSLTLPSYLPVFGRGVFSYRPGEPLADYIRYFDHAPGAGHDDKFEFAGAPYRLRQSKCFLASNSTLTCTTCHDPHEPDRARSIARANTACMDCHRNGNAPHTTSGNCVSCHMPQRRPSDAIHVIITDHLIRRNPQRPAEPTIESNSANTPAYRGEVVPYYPVVDDLYTALAQVKERANPDAGIARLQKAISNEKPADAEPYAELADALRHAGKSAAAIPVYREAISRDAGYWPAWHGLGLATAATGALEESLVPLQRAAELSGRDFAVMRNLALVLTNLHRQDEAISTLRDGIGVHPASPELQNDLGTALLRAGDAAGAEKALRESVRLKPESSTTRYNLAVVLEFRKNLPEAESNLAAALRIDPAYGAAHLKLGEILMGQHRNADALPHLRQAAASTDRNIAQLAAADLARVAP